MIRVLLNRMILFVAAGASIAGVACGTAEAVGKSGRRPYRVTIGATTPCAVISETDATSESVRLSWSCEALDPAGFVVERGLGSHADAFVQLAAVRSPQYVDASVQGRTTYTYRIADRRGGRILGEVTVTTSDAGGCTEEACVVRLTD